MSEMVRTSKFCLKSKMALSPPTSAISFSLIEILLAALIKADGSFNIFCSKY